MNASSLRQRLTAGELLFGLNQTYPAPGLVEIMAPGWDVMWIDGQHGQFGYSELLAAVRACELMGIAAMVRTSGHESGLLGPVADMAPEAIMMPMVNTAAEAKAIVRSLRFPPDGERSYGGRRVTDRHGPRYYKERDLLIVAQIETPQAVEQSEAIAAVPGIDVLFLGPDDMKLRFGLPIETPLLENDELIAAATRTAKAARDAGKFAAIPGVTVDSLSKCKELGYQMFFGGSDVGFIRKAAPALLASFKEAAK